MLENIFRKSLYVWLLMQFIHRIRQLKWFLFHFQNEKMLENCEYILKPTTPDRSPVNFTCD